MAESKRKPPRTPLALALAVGMARDGLHLTDLSKATGVSRSSIERIMSGSSTGSANHRAKLIDWLQQRGWALLMVTESLELIYRKLSVFADDRKGLEREVIEWQGTARITAELARKPYIDNTEALRRFFELARIAADDGKKSRLYRMKLQPGDDDAISIAYGLLIAHLGRLNGLAELREHELDQWAEFDALQEVEREEFKRSQQW